MRRHWDASGRIMIVGQGIIEANERHGFGYGDGCGVLMTDPAWQMPVFTTALRR